MKISRPTVSNPSHQAMIMCIPIIFGCPSKIKPEVTVFSAKSTMWFELFWVPLIPIYWKHIWICGTCQWSEEINKDQSEGQKTDQPSSAATPQADAAPNRPGYQPAYIGQPAPKA
ncbi:hypothetical protein BDZ97DRAFT_171235 [Flammula alnicola]|nr:hypothetical protein BDZ97DRAFT_171235 [Flammula alnicola]